MGVNAISIYETSTIAKSGIPELLDLARQIGEEILLPSVEQTDREALWPEKGMRALQEAGFYDLVIKSSQGGKGYGLFALAKISEELGKYCPSTALNYGMHCVASAVISAKATEAQWDQYLRPIIERRHLTTLALSEPGSGSHFYFPESKLSKDADGSFRISGTKSFVTNASHADSYVVSTVAAEPNAPPGQFSCVMIQNKALGTKWGKPWHGIGMRGNDSRSLELRDTKVAPSDLLGKEGDQLWYVFEIVAPYFLMAMAGTYLGLASKVIDELCTDLKARRHSHSGSGLDQQSVIQHRLGGLWAKLERSRQLLYFAAESGDAGLPNALPAILTSKAEAAHCVVDIVNEAMNLMGGRAYRENSKLERHLRDARAAHVMAPTTDLLYTWTGRAILGLPLLSE